MRKTTAVQASTLLDVSLFALPTRLGLVSGKHDYRAETLAERPGFVATMHRSSSCHLPAHENRELFRREALRRLRGLGVDLPHHDNRVSMHVQPELDYAGASAGLCLRTMIRRHARTAWRLAPSLSAPCHLSRRPRTCHLISDMCLKSAGGTTSLNK